MAPPPPVRTPPHGTTLATNALIERKGARTGLLTTAGFRDALEIGREGRYDMYDLFIDQPTPLVPPPPPTSEPSRPWSHGWPPASPSPAPPRSCRRSGSSSARRPPWPTST